MNQNELTKLLLKLSSRRDFISVILKQTFN